MMIHCCEGEMIHMIRALLTAFVLLSLSPAAMAEDAPVTQQTPPLLMVRQLDASHPERVLLAFHKIAGQEPDFLKWAKLSPFLQKASANDQDAIVSREDNRLRQAWSTFDANQPLVVHTRIQFDDYSTLQEILNLSEFTPKTFFSYSLYNENIAIVPNGIAKFGKIHISKTQMEDMLKKAGGGAVTAEILIKPVVADSKTPYMQDSIPYWLLLAEIAEIRFWNDRQEAPELLWMQRADWYKPKTDSNLLNLKGSTQ